MKINHSFKAFCKVTVSVVTSFSLLLPFFVIPSHALVTGDGTDEVNEAYHEGLSLQPISPAFRLETLMKWTPDRDPDASINRSTIPLNQNRFKGYQINELAHPDARITNAAIINANHDSSPSTGGSDFNIYAFDNWQYIDSLIYWAGTDEGIFALPSPDIVDAAHKNGVPVYATLGFPWGSGQPDSLKELEAMIQQNDDGSFPVADKMIEVAQYFGFDGYFFNQETYGSNSHVANQLNAMLRYMRKKSRELGYPLNISWYDAMANSGNVSHQNAINQYNDLWMKPFDHDDDYGVDEFFINYNWQNRVQGTADYLKMIGRDPFSAYTGFEIQQRSHMTNIDTRTLVGEDKRILSSIALYASNSTMGLARNPEDFHKHENILYTGPQGDPTLADDSASWKGMSRYVVDKSVITGTEFQTSFNSGHGRKWFSEGVVTRDGEWHNRAIQDIMPTWRYWIKDLNRNQSRIDVAYDFDDAYNGGNALKLEGDFKAGDKNELMLFSTRLNVLDSTKIDVVTKTTPNTTLSLGVSFEENYKDNPLTPFTITSDQDGWVCSTVDLGEYAGKMIYAFSLQVESKTDGPFKVNLGHLNVRTVVAPLIQGPENIIINEQLLSDARKGQFRASWDAREGAIYYEVYQVNQDDQEVLLGTSVHTEFYADRITRDDANAFEDNTSIIRVKAVNKDGKRGAPADARFSWGVSLNRSEVVEIDTPINVALNAEVTAVSHQNDAEPASKALDGTAQGNSKWASSPRGSGYMDIKLSEPKTIKRWRVEHAEYGGEAKDMNTINFSLHYQNDDGEWVLAKEIRNNQDAVTDVLLDQPITAQKWKLKIDHAGASPWQAVRIYEWQMFETDAFPRPNNLLLSQVQAKPQSSGIGTLTFKHVPGKTTIHLYHNLGDSKPFKSIKNEKIGHVVVEDFDFKAYDATIYYTIQPEFSEESFKNSFQYQIPKESIGSTTIFVKDDSDQKMVVPFVIKDAMGTVIETGETPLKGLKLDLPIGSYHFIITTLPHGYRDNKFDYTFEVDQDSENNNVQVVLNQSIHYINLTEKLSSFKRLDRNIYTNETLEEVDQVVTKVQAVLDSDTALDHDYKTILDEFIHGIDGLEYKMNAGYLKLQGLIEQMETLDRALYTESTIAYFEAILHDAKALLQTENADESDLNVMHDKLEKAHSMLQMKLNFAKLEALISKAKALDSDLYTEASMMELKDVLENIETSHNTIIDQERVDGLVQALQIAIENLKYNRNTGALEELIQQADAVEFDLYTESSLIRLHDAHKHAKTIAALDEANQQDIDDATDNLRHALTLLEFIHTPQDWEAFDALMATYDTVETKRYHQESIKTLQAHIEAAKLLRSDDTASQNTIDAMADLMVNTLMTLKPIPLNHDQVDKLSELVEQAHALDTTHYTESSINDLECAIVQAEAILMRINGQQFRSLLLPKPVSQDEVDAALEKLEQAWTQLVVKISEDPIEDTQVGVTLPQSVENASKDEVAGKYRDHLIAEDELNAKKIEASKTETVYSTTKNVAELETSLPVTGLSTRLPFIGVMMLLLGLILSRHNNK